ncbi:MAG: hypothetical protein CM1200mP10_15110 [Candidatus Neomarinimicrobiota bacterium]|nr:MAG: hypothetical protein CM1200mP10_15110 [Candidatus Neomarinimicrobiota bacterium]
MAVWAIWCGIYVCCPHLSEKLEPGLVGFRSHKNMWELDASRVDYPQGAQKFEFSTMALVVL